MIEIGDVYMGDWRHGKMEGRGVKTCADGSSLKGQFCDGHLDGFGVKVLIVVSGEYPCHFTDKSFHGSIDFYRRRSIHRAIQSGKVRFMILIVHSYFLSY